MDIVQFNLREIICKQITDDLIINSRLTLDCLKLPFLLPSALATPRSRNTSLGIPAAALAFAMVDSTDLTTVLTLLQNCTHCVMANGGESPEPRAVQNDVEILASFLQSFVFSRPHKGCCKL